MMKSTNNESNTSLMSEESNSFKILGNTARNGAEANRSSPRHVQLAQQFLDSDTDLSPVMLSNGFTAVPTTDQYGDDGSGDDLMLEEMIEDDQGFRTTRRSQQTPSEPARHKEGTSSIMNAVLNFTNSIVGAGIIGLPFALAEAGFWSGILLLTGLAAVVDWTVRLLVRTSKLAGTNSYQDLMEFCFGSRGLILISFFQFIFAFGAMCAYTVIVGDTVPVVLRHFLGNNLSPFAMFITSRRFIIVLTTLSVTLPLSMYRDISKLAKASAFAMVALVFILLAVIIEGPLVDSSLRAPPSLDFIHSGFLQAVGVISFAFVCHHNSFLIYGSLIKPTLDRWEIVTHISTSLSWLFSLAMALAGYLIFGAKTEGNILNNYASDSVLMNFARLAFAANMFTTFPLECFVCREVIEHYFFPKQVISYRFHTLVTVSLTLVALAISLTTCDLGVVLEITGCFSATALAYILPPACYLKLADGDMLSSKKIWPLACACFGFLVMIVSTVMALVNAFSNTTKKQCVW